MNDHCRALAGLVLTDADASVWVMAMYSYGATLRQRETKVERNENSDDDGKLQLKKWYQYKSIDS